ncbi:unnamed protein product [Bemisia tabaci]|uniref:Uncharacterized protein n=1 Tax=Bemisia tabaci TaxID=7038 RepID=A0A9P0A844_BEMTA|nr:unnamed protein product [Bemisia tabaci]
MAATVNHHNDKFSGSEPPEEDIAAIAKQISDHAEAIYQNWKSSGLAPTEILSCHTENKFSSVLTPKQSPKPQPAKRNQSPVMELLASEPTRLNTNNLEQFFALQKFERNCAQPPDFSYRKSPSPVRNINGNGNGNGTTAKDTTISKYIVDPVTSFPEHLIPTTAAPAMSTWPLKKPAPGSTTKKPSPTPMPEAEVVREEERLINALKTGVMDTVDDSSPKPYSCKLVNEENKNMLRNRGVANGGTANGNGTTNGNGAKEVTGLSALSARRLRPNGGWSSREVPHPELSSQQKANIRSGSAANLINPVRPFLTRGSVAERVLIFEKCPTELCLDKRKTTVGSVANRVQALDLGGGSFCQCLKVVLKDFRREMLMLLLLFPQ